MKTNKIYIALLALALCGGFTSCEDFLDKEPASTVPPEGYFTEASHLKAFADGLYTGILPSHDSFYGMFDNDNGTDNQINIVAENRYTKDLWKVSNEESSDWNFETIYRINFFMENVLPKFGDDNAQGDNISGTNNSIAGDLAEIKHYIGEMFFLRACEYFKRYQKFGDFPIITEALIYDKDKLIEASKRMPRTEVARFILADLDKAIELLGAKTMATTRISQDLAYLFKSRVALFEGTWLKYFKGTPFVPNGEGWPGAFKDYNAGYQFKSGGIDEEIKYFLQEAMVASKVVADKYRSQLTANTYKLQPENNDTPNPYYDMFAQDNLSGVPEVLLWRQYINGLATHNVCTAANGGNYLTGMTRGYVNNFLTIEGLPTYAYGTDADGDGIHYFGDKSIADVRKNRDTRLSLFLKQKGQVNISVDDMTGIDVEMTEPAPNILNTGDNQRGYVTGYALRKGAPFKKSQYAMDRNTIAAPSYRAAEALLNYMEASYELKYPNGGGTPDWDPTAKGYWEALRTRAGITGTIASTVNATDMAKEAKNDWAAKSANQPIDKVLYNIRRERRCEFLSEGLRYMDLCRWRAMDQLINEPYIPMGFHLWGTEIESWYPAEDLNTAGNVSPKNENDGYYCPYRKDPKQTCYDGLTWKMAHYLTPIMAKQFLITAPDGVTVSSSPLYQNPYWPMGADKPAEQ